MKRDPVGRYLSTNAREWRSGSKDGQMAVLAGLMLVTVVMFILSLTWYDIMPAATFIVPIVIGSVLLQWWPQAALSAVALFASTVTALVDSFAGGFNSSRPATLVTVYAAAGVLLYSASRYRSGLPAALSEAMLMELRDRLQKQGTVPKLPDGWVSESAMESAGSAKFAGDFLVANLSKDDKYLELMLVDVCGKGVAAGTQSLQLAGALGGLIGSLPPLGLFAAGNDYLLRQGWDEGFATAVHVIVNLETGAFEVLNAGHPPAMQWDADKQEWIVSGARGMALGIIQHPEFRPASGELRPGEALMFYTDGVVETRSLDLEVGIDWLRGAARLAIAPGIQGAPARIMDQTEAGEDDRAVLILSRSPA
ncbi:PP2C family protein-serine/threonine phosphatase [Aeromicrobium sp. 179-A 4D2 NHS]|uniref:PP2C family protein-serine/threonine phosphatase n=1 Tax=Aeromicrobium sp. 179-A 4D2 NHS TaxID=3142375 RepID=UPI0039A157A3